MAFTPSSDIYLCNVPLDSNYNHTLSFLSPTAQNVYFQTKKLKSFENVTYVRKDNVIKVNADLDSLWNCNYLFYRNENFGAKWFYAFITKMNYVNGSTTEITIETDVVQTWMFDVSHKKSFVVREHVSDDTIGLNRVDEGLELGEYVYNNPVKISNLGDRFGVFAVSDTAPFGGTGTIGNIYGMTPSGLAYYPFTLDAAGAAWLKEKIQNFAAVGKVDAIQMIFTVPELAVRGTTGVGGWVMGTPLSGSYNPIIEAVTSITQGTLPSGYTPKNNKLYTDPFSFLYVSNNTGSSAKFAWEEFTNRTATFNIASAIGPNPMSLLLPTNYKGLSTAHDHALPLDGFPVGSWTSDTFTAWFAQNGVGVGIGAAVSIGTVAAGIATANPMLILGGAQAIIGQLAQVRQASIQPDQAKGHTAAGPLRYSLNNLGYYYSKASVNSYFAQLIDDYFSMFGYKVNALKVPELDTRANWNYIQTIDANVIGNLPQEDLNRYKKALNDGITFWHDAVNFLDYSQVNPII